MVEKRHLTDGSAGPDRCQFLESTILVILENVDFSFDQKAHEGPLVTFAKNDFSLAKLISFDIVRQCFDFSPRQLLEDLSLLDHGAQFFPKAGAVA